MKLKEFITKNEGRIYFFGGWDEPYDYVIKHPDESTEVMVLNTYYNCPVLPVFKDGEEYVVREVEAVSFDDEPDKVGYVILSY